MSLAQLTERQRTIVQLLADGSTTAEIAAKLRYCARTVKADIHRAMRLANVRTRAHLVAEALRAQVVT